MIGIFALAVSLSSPLPTVRSTYILPGGKWPSSALWRPSRPTRLKDVPGLEPWAPRTRDSSVSCLELGAIQLKPRCLWQNKYTHQDNSTTAVAVVLLQSNFYLHALVWPTFHLTNKKHKTICAPRAPEPRPSVPPFVLGRTKSYDGDFNLINVL